MHSDEMQVHIDLSGGLDLVFDGRTQLSLSAPANCRLEEIVMLLAGQANTKRDMFVSNGRM